MSLNIFKTSCDSDSQLIESCKSAHMLKGYPLRHAHYNLGLRIAPMIADGVSVKRSFAVIAMMRAGFFFAQGIADKLEMDGYDVSLLPIQGGVISEEDLNRIKTRDALFVDAVINSGKSILALLSQLPSSSVIKIATTVIPEKSIATFTEYELFAIRTSENQYKGAKVDHIANGKGPDTGDRLFNTL